MAGGNRERILSPLLRQRVYVPGKLLRRRGVAHDQDAGVVARQTAQRLGDLHAGQGRQNGVGRARHGADHHDVLGKVHGDHALAQDVAQPGVGGAGGALLADGVAVAPPAGQLLHQPQLLDVPGDGGLGGPEAPLLQLQQQLLLGLYVACLDDLQYLRLSFTLHGAHPPNF